MHIKVIKLVNGTEFVGQLDPELSTDKNVVVKTAFQLVYQKVENEGNVGMAPFLAPVSMSAKDPRAGYDLAVCWDNLLGIPFDPNSMVVDMYQQLTGAVWTPPSKSNVIHVQSFTAGEKVQPV